MKRITITIGNIELRQFGPGDARELYCIRNHPSVREFMSNPAPLPYAAHCQWTRAKLIDEQTFHLFLVRLRGERAIGMTLLRPVAPDTAEIGVMFREATRHPFVPYISTVATLHLAYCHLNLTTLVSYVLPAHSRAISLNSSLGAWTLLSDKPPMTKFCLSREVCLANENYRKVFERFKNRLTIAEEVLGPAAVAAPASFCSGSQTAT